MPLNLDLVGRPFYSIKFFLNFLSDDVNILFWSDKISFGLGVGVGFLGLVGRICLVL